MTLRAEQAPMVIGAVLLVLLGTFYVFEAHRLRDWSVRMMQRESYLTWVRVTGAIMVLAGIGMLYRDGARAPRYAIMAGRGPLKRRHAGTPFHLLPLDEAEVEGHLPPEDQLPPVARACDRRAWQHPPRGHPDDLLPNAAAQDDTVASNFDVIKRHPVRPIDHDPSRSGSRVGRASCTPLGAALVGAVRGRIRELSTPYASFDGGCKGRRALLGRSAIVHSRSATPAAMGGGVSNVMCRRTKL